MSHETQCTTTPDQGFAIIQEADAARQRLTRGGPAALTSLIMALIWSRKRHWAEILDAVCEIGGEHMRSAAEQTLMLGTDKHWIEIQPQRYVLDVEFGE